MMSYATIRELADEATQAAEEQGLEPERVEDALAYFKATGRFNIPNLGDYVPEGWERCEQIDDLFVDASGMGSESEPALTIKQFVKELEKFAKARDHYAVGISEVGQFQIFVRLYRPDSRDFTHTGKLTEHDLNQVRRK